MKTFGLELYAAAALVRQRAETPGLDRLEALRLESLADTIQAEGRIQRGREKALAYPSRYSRPLTLADLRRVS